MTPGKVLHRTPLEGARASGVTCVKFAPSSAFILLGYGVRESADVDGDGQGNPNDFTGQSDSDSAG